MVNSSTLRAPALGGRRRLRNPRTVGLRLVPWAARLVAAIGCAAVIGLWWHDTPEVHGLGDWLTNAGRVTGLIAGYAVVIQLALMSRFPLLERGIGADQLTRWHASGGRFTVSMAVTHTLLIIWGYAVTAHAGVVKETGVLLTGYEDVLMATAALFLLVGVGISSARAARRRLRYETWHLLHLYTYLAIALAFAHQFAVGADFVDNGRARLLWSAYYAVVGALLLVYRVVVPVARTLRHQLRVADVQQEDGDAVSVYLTGRRLPDLQAEPGQFFRWRFLTRDLWWAANPYSLSAAPREDWLRITVKVTGDHSAGLRTLRPGTRVFAEGPYGSFTAARRTRHQVLLIAGGVGITPLLALFESLPAGPGDVTLVYRASNPDDIVLSSELDLIARSRGARLHYLIGSREQQGGDPLAAHRLQELVPDLRNHDVFICGPEAMADAVNASLRQARVPRRHIHRESFQL